MSRSGCPYCVRAKELAAKLTSDQDSFNYQYVDIQATGITKADLEARAGKPVTTVPQIFIDDRHIGGYTAGLVRRIAAASIARQG
ncbi:glutaredoxin [Pantoea sp. BRM17]|nr:glutaredoxin [Pantoea sp. BRM17]